MFHLPTVYHCLRLPASGDPVERLPYTTVNTATFAREGDDDVLDVVADLRPHWTGDYQDRMIQRVILPSYLGGELLLYYATAGTRPANKTLLNVPAVREAVNDAFHADELFGRIFYRGDVFVVRLGAVWEDADFETDYEDVAEWMVAEVVAMVQDLAVRNWRHGFLEYQRKQSDLFNRVESGALLAVLGLTDRWLAASERERQSYSVNTMFETLLEREEAMYGWGEGTQARAKLKREPEDTQGRARVKRERKEDIQGKGNVKRERGDDGQVGGRTRGKWGRTFRVRVKLSTSRRRSVRDGGKSNRSERTIVLSR